jgi:hypothetical protein
MQQPMISAIYRILSTKERILMVDITELYWKIVKNTYCGDYELAHF